MATTNIYIESSFVDLKTDGAKDVNQEVCFDAPDNIGGRDLLVELSYPTTASSVLNTNVYYTTSTVSSGTPLMFQNEYFRVDSMVSGTLTSLIEWTNSPPTLSGSKYVNVDYFNRHDFSAGDQVVNIHFISGDTTVSGVNAVAIGFVTVSGLYSSINVKQRYMNFSGNYDYWGNPIGSLSGTGEVLIDYFTHLPTFSGVIDNVVDITFSGWVPWNTQFDVFSVLENVRDGQKYYFPVDVSTTSGGLTGTTIDVFASLEDMSYFGGEVKSAKLVEPWLWFDVNVTPGVRNTIDFDVWSCVVTSGTLVADVDLFPMYFDNFSLGVGQYMPASGTICVDVHDELYTVVTSGTYFMIDGVPVSGTLTPISDGYRICYNPDDDFASLNGVTTFTARAENTNGDVLTRDFYVTFGYVVEYNNIPDIGIDYGFYNKIGVRVEASNLMNCPIDDAFGFWFVSKDYSLRDLAANIVGVPPTEGTLDLSAKIYPVSTAYFYDKVFRIELNVKDYAGNEMEPFILVFKVENLDKD